MATKYVEQPAGTRVRVLVRTGATPTFDGKQWTDWRALDEPLKPASDTHRWAQIRFELETDHPQRTPRIGAKLVLRASGPPQDASTRVKLKFLTPTPPQTTWPR